MLCDDVPVFFSTYLKSPTMYGQIWWFFGEYVAVKLFSLQCSVWWLDYIDDNDDYDGEGGGGGCSCLWKCFKSKMMYRGGRVVDNWCWSKIQRDILFF